MKENVSKMYQLKRKDREMPLAEATESVPFIAVKELVASYGEKIAVRGVSLSVNPGEQLSLLGPSGCGKSTLLRCIAGLETPISGEIVIDGRVVFSSKDGRNVPPEKRMLSMVFQSYAIWPHMTVFENVAYGLRVQGIRRSELAERVNRALEMVGMAEFSSRPATSLSGGQQQRVALARAYAPAPKAILLDEPLSNLDARLRTQMREELKHLQKRIGVSTIYVTHDQEEAMAMSDRVIVLRDGRVEQDGTPLSIYDRPRSRFVADFIGAANILRGRFVAGASGSEPFIRIGDAEIRCAKTARREDATTSAATCLVAIRAVYPELLAKPDAGAVNQWPATIVERVLLGDIVNYKVKFPGGVIRVQASPKRLFEEQSNVVLSIPPERVVPIEES